MIKSTIKELVEMNIKLKTLARAILQIDDVMQKGYKINPYLKLDLERMLE